jgi:hypothetical protein
MLARCTEPADELVDRTDLDLIPERVPDFI